MVSILKLKPYGQQHNLAWTECTTLEEEEEFGIDVLQKIKKTNGMINFIDA